MKGYWNCEKVDEHNNCTVQNTVTKKYRYLKCLREDCDSFVNRFGYAEKTTKQTHFEDVMKMERIVIR